MFHLWNHGNSKWTIQITSRRLEICWNLLNCPYPNNLV
jgi:hypothetical protein